MLLPVLEVAAIMILEIAQAVKVLHQRHISSIVIDKVPCNVMPSDKELIISRPCQRELAMKGGILEDQIFLKQTAIETGIFIEHHIAKVGISIKSIINESGIAVEFRAPKVGRSVEFREHEARRAVELRENEVRIIFEF
jgi:hypothetical protein